MKITTGLFVTLGSIVRVASVMNGLKGYCFNGTAHFKKCKLLLELQHFLLLVDIW